MGRAQSDTYISLFNKNDNVNLDKTFDRKSVFVHVLSSLYPFKTKKATGSEFSGSLRSLFYHKSVILFTHHLKHY